jgi:hypothetical protein
MLGRCLTSMSLQAITEAGALDRKCSQSKMTPRQFANVRIPRLVHHMRDGLSKRTTE